MAAKQFAKMINGKICLTTSALTEVLGISQQALSFWESQGCPKEMRGWWSVRDVLTWKGLISTGGLNTFDEVEKISWNQKKLEAEARLKEQKFQEAEFKNAISKGEYIRKEEITAELQRFFVILKRSMLGYSRRIERSLRPMWTQLLPGGSRK
jgi:phage terminase Nu1 subunit (DNA packaging protein)